MSKEDGRLIDLSEGKETHLRGVILLRATNATLVNLASILTRMHTCCNENKLNIIIVDIMVFI